jgi:hypothetical protein
MSQNLAPLIACTRIALFEIGARATHHGLEQDFNSSMLSTMPHGHPPPNPWRLDHGAGQEVNLERVTPVDARNGFAEPRDWKPNRGLSRSHPAAETAALRNEIEGALAVQMA